jgi:hypothetical protein
MVDGRNGIAEEMNAIAGLHIAAAVTDRTHFHNVIVRKDLTARRFDELPFGICQDLTTDKEEGPTNVKTSLQRGRDNPHCGARENAYRTGHTLLPQSRNKLSYRSEAIPRELMRKGQSCPTNPSQGHQEMSQDAEMG